VADKRESPPDDAIDLAARITRRREAPAPESPAPRVQADVISLAGPDPTPFRPGLIACPCCGAKPPRRLLSLAGWYSQAEVFCSLRCAAKWAIDVVSFAHPMRPKGGSQ
jgi:hypothetical protein